MPINLSSFQNKTRTVTVKFSGDECQVTYRVNAITPDYIDSFRDLKSSSEIYVKQICELVTKWQVLDERGREIKPDKKLVSSLSTDFLYAVLEAIREDRKLPEDQKNA